jgi:hypothetical protein
MGVQDYECDLFWFRHMTWMLLFLMTLIGEFFDARCALKPTRPPSHIAFFAAVREQRGRMFVRLFVCLFVCSFVFPCAASEGASLSSCCLSGANTANLDVNAASRRTTAAIRVPIILCTVIA